MAVNGGEIREGRVLLLLGLSEFLALFENGRPRCRVKLLTLLESGEDFGGNPWPGSVFRVRYSDKHF